MISTTRNIAVNPTIAGNLQGLASVRIEYQLDFSQVPIFLAKFPGRKLSGQVDDALARAGLTKDDDSNAVLTVAIAVQPSLIPQLGGVAALFAVEVAVRELVILPRAADDLTTKNNIRPVDTWRHKVTTGILLPESSYADSSALLFATAIQQVERLISAWQADQAYRPTTPPGPPRRDDPPPPPQTTDPSIAKIRAKLEELLSPLAQGNEGSATLEEFDVSGTKVSFKAKIRHRHVAGNFFGKKVIAYDVTTHASGSFDAADASSLKGKVCADKPAILGGGEACFSLEDLKPAI